MKRPRLRSGSSVDLLQGFMAGTSYGDLERYVFLVDLRYPVFFVKFVRFITILRVAKSVSLLFTRVYVMSPSESLT